MSKIHYSLDDIALVPAPFTEVKSRKDVDTSQELCGYLLQTPVIASNMDTVYSPDLARETAKHGAISCVHRFCSINENVMLFQAGIYEDVVPWVSIGVGNKELERAEALVNVGAKVIVIDLANGACQAAVDQYRAIRELYKVKIVVGNFVSKEQILEFVDRAGHAPDAFKVSIGSGSACETSVRTGVFVPAVTCIESCVSSGYPIIFDGGVKDGGDLCKMLSLGVKAAFVGRLFASCWESGAERDWNKRDHKIYRGSAAKSSYEDQGKTASFRAPEGAEYLVPITGTVEDLLNLLNGSIRSSMSYCNSFNLTKFRQSANIINISQSSSNLTTAFGKYSDRK